MTTNASSASRRVRARNAIRDWFARSQLGPAHNYVTR
jgi:hypothetical protein